MKVSLNWLKDYIDIDMTPEALSSPLTMAGLEVEGMTPVGHSLDRITAARILEVSPHPNADRLQVCKVDTGKDKCRVVSGAPDIQVNSLVPFAPDGARLPNGTIIKAGMFRGVLSQGMLLAEDELGLTDDHTGLMVLPEDVAVGTPLSALGFSDWVFDLSITPNRPDWTSVLGVAREIAALTGKELRWPDVDYPEGDLPIETLTSVKVLDAAGCPRYAAGVIRDVQTGRSPFWTRYRLFQSGIRSINNIVDVTNYVLLELGQPLHSFDFHRLAGNRIEVKRAIAGERFKTLDGEERPLNNESLMICDAEKYVALAGIMGGLNSEIEKGTRHILIESAFFNPAAIRRESKRHGLSTEASYRFERGVDIEGVPFALKRAISLISRLAGGKIAKGIIDQYPISHVRPEITVRVNRTNQILGLGLSGKKIAGYLQSLGMSVRSLSEHELVVDPPAYRVDVTREIDLIEEVARLDGYGNVPVTYPSVRPMENRPSEELILRDRLRTLTAGLGFTEIITFSFISPDSADILEAAETSPLRSFVRVMNPLTVDQSVMRTSMIPGLMTALKNNISYGEKDLRIFEWGKLFFQRENEDLPREKNCLAAAVTGSAEQKSWYSQERKTDFYDIKGAVEALLEGLGCTAVSFMKEGTDLTGYDPGKSAGIFVDSQGIGVMGRISSKVTEAYGLEKEDVYAFELDIPALLHILPGTVRFKSFTRFPAVYRDLSLLVGKDVASERLLRIAQQTGGELLESVGLYDLYEGKNLNPSEKALTFRLCYRSKEETLDGAAVNELHDQIIQNMRLETGGRLREG